MRYSSRWVAVLAAFVAVLALALPAVADTVTNDVTSSDPAFFEVDGGSEEIVYTLNQTGGDGQAGCNAALGQETVMTVTPPTGLIATPATVMFSGCGAGNAKSIVYTATAPGVYAPASFAFSVSGGRGGTYTTTGISHQVIAYDLESFTVNPEADPLNCTGIVTDTWDAGDAVCLRLFAIPNSLSVGGGVTFDVTAPDGTVTSVVGPSGGNRSAITVRPTTCGRWSVVVSAGGSALDTDTFDVENCPEATFQAPVDGPSVVNVAKTGRVIPVKALVSRFGAPVTEGPVSLELRRWAGCGEGTADGIETFAAAGSSNEGNLFRPADGGWIYNLDTSGLTVGCYRAEVSVGDLPAGWFLIRLAR